MGADELLEEGGRLGGRRGGEFVGFRGEGEGGREGEEGEDRFEVWGGVIEVDRIERQSRVIEPLASGEFVGGVFGDGGHWGNWREEDAEVAAWLRAQKIQRKH